MSQETATIAAPRVRLGRFRLTQARREAIAFHLFAAPWIIGFLVFTLGPMIASFLLSFTAYDIITPARWIGFDNYRTMFTSDGLVWQALRVTFTYSLIGVPLGLALSFMVALLLNQKVRGITLFRTAYYIPAIVPAVPSIALFLWLLHDRFGLINEALFRFFNVPGPHWLTSPEWAKPALILWSVWGVGAGMIIYLAGLQGVPQELYEAAHIDGASTLRRFWHVTIPMISPTLFFVLCVGIIGSFQVFTPVFLLGSQNYGMAAAGPLDSLLFWVIYLYNQGFFYFNMGYASAMAWVLFIAVLAVTLLQLWLAGRWVYYEADTPGR
jgi:multiple sugar transport system permease protein